MTTASLVDLGMRFAARDLGRPVPALQYQQQRIRRDARVLSILAMSGDHVGLWGIAVGSADLPRPKMMVVADPRRRDEQSAIWRFLADHLDSYLRWCDEQSLCPQIVVADEQCWAQIVAAAHRFAWSRDPSLSAAAAAITVLAERAETAGQQAIVTAAELLARHAITGADPDQEHGLAALLSWHTGVQPTESATAGECAIPDALDTEVSPLAKRLRRTERHGGARAIDTCRASMANLIEPVLTQRWDRINAALSTLTGLNLPLLPALDAVAADDDREWRRWAARRAEGKHPLRPSARSAMVALVAREHAASRWTHLQYTHDDIVYTRGEFSGNTVTLRVQSISDGLVVGATDRTPRLRVGDVVGWRQNHKVQFVVTELDDEEGRTRITLEMTGAKRENVLPDNAKHLQLLPKFSARNPVAITLTRLGGDRMPWTHRPGPEQVPADAPRWRHDDARPAPHCAAAPRPGDVLGMAASLRNST